MKLWDEIQYLIKLINGGEAGEYKKRFHESQIQSK